MGEDGALDRLRAEHCGMFLMNNAVLCSKNGVALCYILTAISVVLKFYPSAEYGI